MSCSWCYDGGKGFRHLCLACNFTRTSSGLVECGRCGVISVFSNIRVYHCLECTAEFGEKNAKK